MTKPSTKLIQGDCLEVMPTLPENSVDTIITDPPYGLTFMGKEWDRGVPGVAFWEAALRVAKPGAFLLAFGGTRTYHRLACAIEDAGWEIRDCMMWLYGCLSEDTEVLTRDGWKRYPEVTNHDIAIYDVENDIYKWEKPQRWSAYRIDSDTAYRITSSHTDQLVSRNHRCLVEREGRLVFVRAEELSSVEAVPTLPGDIRFLQEEREGLLQPEMQWPCSGKGVGEARWQGEGVLDQGIRGSTAEEDDRAEQPRVEGRGDISESQGAIFSPTYQVSSVSTRVPVDVSEGRLRDGAPFESRHSYWQAPLEYRSGSPYQPRCNGQSTREPYAICIECGPQAVRTRTTYQTTVATVTPVKYSGLIFCPTVTTGAFVARRNGKVFITGNSGFPKSMDISKAIDKAAGAERPVVGTTKSGGYKRIMEANVEQGFRPADYYEEGNKFTSKEAITDDAKLWNGWGTALKPAWEPIIVAMKPFKGTYAKNALEHGVAGLNIDGCRIGETNSGRWPANVILDEEAAASLDEQSGVTKPKKGRTGKRGGKGFGFFDDEKSKEATGTWPDDPGGGASRFFYCAKASKKEKGPGNNHPTVKPLALMEYLCKLTATPTGGVVLDPFMGSGTTALAARNTGRDFIGIELDDDYFQIAKKRVA